MIDRKLYRYIYDLTIKGLPMLKEDIINDFISYKLPNIKITNKTYVLNCFKNYSIDVVKKHNRIKNIETEYLDSKYDEIDNDLSYEDRLKIDEDNIKKIEIIISYIKKLPTHERELFKQYYINKLSTRKLGVIYNIDHRKIHRKVKKYKDDIKSLHIIDGVKGDIKEFMTKLASNNYTYTTLDALKITNYHIILFQWKDSKYYEVEKDIYQMIEDIKKEIK